MHGNEENREDQVIEVEESRIESKHSVHLAAGVRRDSRKIGRLLTCEGDQGKSLGS